MKIVKNWTTVELIEFLNTYRTAKQEDKERHKVLLKAVHTELTIRQPLIGMAYTV
ncbi:TPA: hypothetical protein QC364_000683 [Bacillus cereus]|uniref:hypothetical protein n=1 Tax=Bacillus paranthracis TaxID=2026186 RepID=UPI002D79C608|nr:hypothetical protein [Bacillus paranthracis]HDR8453893.1 hypothetical protein [Bacillus cereus]